MAVSFLLVLALFLVVVVALLTGSRGAQGSLVARVAVDDLAVGRLPAVCVKTGGSADAMVEVEGSEGGFQPWWLLLLFLGPLGIVAIVALWAFSRRTNRVGGQVPLSAAALDDYNRAVRSTQLATAVAFGGLVVGVGAVWAHASSTVSWARPVGVAGALAVVAGLVATLVASWIAQRRWVDVRLDGSGRWAVLSGVHPAFVAAVRDRYAGHRPADLA